MTTLVGIRVNSGLDYIVLASDNQETRESNSTKKAVQKIHIGPHWAIGYMGGSYDNESLRRFLGVLRADGRYLSKEEREGFSQEIMPQEIVKAKAEKMVESALEKGFFEEIGELNRETSKRDRDISYSHAFLFATRFPKMGLWHIDEFGSLLDFPEDRDFDYFCVGSGSGEAENYFQTILRTGKIGEKEFDGENIDLGCAILLASGAIEYASQRDLYTGLGYDLVIVPESIDEKILSWQKRIKDNLEEANRKTTKSIIESYTQTK